MALIPGLAFKIWYQCCGTLMTYEIHVSLSIGGVSRAASQAVLAWWRNALNYLYIRRLTCSVDKTSQWFGWFSGSHLTWLISYHMQKHQMYLNENFRELWSTTDSVFINFLPYWRQQNAMEVKFCGLLRTKDILFFVLDPVALSMLLTCSFVVGCCCNKQGLLPAYESGLGWIEWPYSSCLFFLR